MIYSVSGKIILKKPKLVVIEAVGLGLEFIVSPRTSKNLPKINSKAKIFCTPCVNKDGVELYGFLTEEEKQLFDVVNSAPGIGPKSAMGLLENFSQDKLFSIINNNRADLLAQIGGMGQKRSERLILELKSKIKKSEAGSVSSLGEDLELTEILKALGYNQKEIKEAIAKLSAEGETRHGRPEKSQKIEERLRSALALFKN